MTAISQAVREMLAREIAGAGGREVFFVAAVGEDGVITSARPVARGTIDTVLALPGVAEKGMMVLHNHPSGDLEPSQADLTVAARTYEGGAGFGIIDNEVTSLYVVVEVPRAKRYNRLDPVETANLLGPRGPLSGALGRFEDRSCQRDMASHVCDAYNDGGVSLLEAGTGVGKSFAYLVPALCWAKSNPEDRTIVSTNTINLQEQLVGKDLPVLKRILADENFTPTFALLKGWNNYVCLSRLGLAGGGQASLFEPEHRSELGALREWASATRDGSRSDLTVPPSPEVWDEICAEADLCPRNECPHYHECFFIAAHAAAATANVVVVNHHLLTSDLAVRIAQDNWTEKAVLPGYRRLVVDEAQHLEDTAAKHMGASVTSRGVTRLLSRLERNGKGLIPTLMAELHGRDDLASKASFDLLQKALLPEVTAARAHSDRVFTILCDRLAAGTADPLRIDDSFSSDPIWELGLGIALDNLVSVFGKLRDGVETVADRMMLDEDHDSRSLLLTELRGVVRRLQAVTDALLQVLRPGRGAKVVRWIERRGNKPVGPLPFPLGMAAVPLDLAPVLRESLFDRVDTVVLTSATLAAGGDFSFLKERLGLDLPPSPLQVEASLPSPFDFAEQCLLGIPTDVPDPRHDTPGHDLAVQRAVVDLARASDGGMFVLFTSYAALRRVAAAVRNELEGRWPVLVQGEGQRDRLLRRFRDAGSAILFGTDSFWEGVDVPGPSLRALVLAKLPFKVPSDPLTAARLELLAEQGIDGFRHYLMPHAALKLKQGFGRLIRSRSDIGIVILMDSRVTTRNYGRKLLASLPPARRVVDTWDVVKADVVQFFATHGIGGVPSR